MANIYTLPIDNIKTRLMNQSADPSRNRFNYTGSLDVLAKSLKYEGLNGLFTGLIPAQIKILAYSMVTIYFNEIVTSSFKRAAKLEDWQI